MTDNWPQGPGPIDVGALIEQARSLMTGGETQSVRDRARDTLTAINYYVGGLPVTAREDVCARLVAAICAPARAFVAGVRLRR